MTNGVHTVDTPESAGVTILDGEVTDVHAESSGNRLKTPATWMYEGVGATNTPIVFPSRMTGLDGKSYPAAPLPAKDRAFLIDAVHHFHCAERLSVRNTLACIQDEHGIRRSVGWAAGVLKTYECAHCSGERNGTPEQVRAPNNIALDCGMVDGAEKQP